MKSLLVPDSINTDFVILKVGPNLQNLPSQSQHYKWSTGPVRNVRLDWCRVLAGQTSPRLEPIRSRSRRFWSFLSFARLEKAESLEQVIAEAIQRNAIMPINMQLRLSWPLIG